MTMENWDIKYYESMTNINYLGALRVTTTLVPFYEKQGFGRLVFNASLSSYFDLPYGGGTIDVNVKDWLHLQEDGIIINHSKMKKFGFTVGELVITIIKQ